MVRRAVILAVILALLSVNACESGRQVIDWRGNAQNVILIVIDTLAAHNLAFMGYDRPTSPFMDELAARCIVFDRAYSPRATTLPAFTSIFSGLHPIQHNVMRNGQPLPDTLHMLTSDFRDAGYRTVGIPATNILASRYGINRGFEHYFDIQGRQDAAQIKAAEVIGKLREFLNSDTQARADFEEEVDSPLFLFIHFFDPHTPYSPEAADLAQFADRSYDGPVNGRFYDVFRDYNSNELELNDRDIQHARDMYDADILTFDRQLRRLFDLLDQYGLIENSVILLTADHGENLGEHHQIGHGPLYEIALHVPMMFHFPNDLGAGTRIEGTVEILDALPTLMDLFDIPIPGGLNGTSLVPLLDDPTDPDGVSRDYSLAAGSINEEGRRAYSVFDGHYRLIKDISWSEDSLLYDVMADPQEENDLADNYPAVVEHLEAIITSMAAGEKPYEDFEMDPETAEILRSLGYLN